MGGVGPLILPVIADHADWWNIPSNYLSRYDELRSMVGAARVSVLQTVGFVADEADRGRITETAERRFGQWEGSVVVGDVAELTDYFAHLRARGVERVYAWFTDGAAIDTIDRFGEVARSLAST